MQVQACIKIRKLLWDYGIMNIMINLKWSSLLEADDIAVLFSTDFRLLL